MPELIPLSVLGLDVPEPQGGWVAELAGRGVEIVLDDVGREAVDCAVARTLLAEHREQEAAAARHRAAVEERLIAADAARRAAMPPGIPVSAEVPGLTPAMLMMAADPLDQSRRRESVLEHALSNRDGAVYHPLREES